MTRILAGARVLEREAVTSPDLQFKVTWRRPWTLLSPSVEKAETLRASRRRKLLKVVSNYSEIAFFQKQDVLIDESFLKFETSRVHAF
ncbi:hypothetical protein J6590_019530 [Homalodisca vitripennis]|nr:hypothetical protein J6590_019530 [Homalodisca vitripennis]